MFDDGMAACAVAKPQTVDDKQAGSAQGGHSFTENLTNSTFNSEREGGKTIENRRGPPLTCHPPPVTRPIPMILCADDYGLSHDIDRAILDLCRAGRLTAVSCMV